MKTTITTLIILSIFYTTIGQITETVTIEPDQTNQTWYSLENGTQGTANASEWDLAFDLSSFGTSIYANNASGVSIWVYENGDIHDWNNIDTSGLHSWQSLYNSDTTWSMGAFDVTSNTNNPLDVGWGIYNTITHAITGDSIHIIELKNGDYKKFKIEQLIGGSYQFSYADLDGSNEVATSITKADFQNKLFGYYSIENGQEIDREPVAVTEWDLLFTKYTAFFPMAYPVAGILVNNNTEVVQVDGVSDVPSFVDWQSQSFSTEINIIGYDWKSFNGTGYDIVSDVVYFVKTQNEDIWKVVPTDFGGNTSGDFEFIKEKLSSASISELDESSLTFSVYPNPCNGEKAYLLYNSNEVDSFQATIRSATGQTVSQISVKPNNSFETQTIDISKIPSGIYFVEVNTNGRKAVQKLIIQK